MTSPVCGWVVPNNLETSLMIYDGQGRALGYIDRKGSWQTAPGRDQPAGPEGIPNAPLQQMVAWIMAQAKGSQEFIRDFNEVLDTALENIAPDNSAQHEALALLMGRPMALVRAFVNLELQGLPASRQSWHDLYNRLQGKRPDTDGFCDVKFPFRIGEHWRLNDGVVGYWLEEEAGKLDPKNRFHAPQSNEIKFPSGDNPFIFRDSPEELRNFEHSLNDPPQLISLLMDPRGLAHCTCGVLPTKSLSLPTEHTKEALRQINVSFLAAPLLTEPGRVTIPLPTEPGFTWTWMQQDAARWMQLTTTPMVEKAALQQVFGPINAAVWQALSEQKWIEPLPASQDRANIVLPPPEDGLKPPEGVYAAIIEHFLAGAPGVTPPVVRKADIERAFGEDTDVVWQALIQRNWIEPLPDSPDRARVVLPRPNAPGPDETLLPPVGVNEAAVIPRVLDRSQRVLTDVSREARFGPAREIREGWLELTPATSADIKEKP